MQIVYDRRVYEGEANGEGVVHAARYEGFEADTVTACRVWADGSGFFFRFFHAPPMQVITCLRCVAAMLVT